VRDILHDLVAETEAALRNAGRATRN
jgi:hypothetical protein